MQIICFEDHLVEKLQPVVHARPAYAITCASFRLVDWLRRLDGKLRGSVRDYLVAIQHHDYQLSPPSLGQPGDASNDVLLVNARLAPTTQNFESLKTLARADATRVVLDPEDASVLAALMSARDVDEIRRIAEGNLAATEREPVGADAPTATHSAVECPRVDGLLRFASRAEAAPVGLQAFRWPHDVVSIHMNAMVDSMQWRIDHGDYTQREDGVFVAPGVSIGQYASIHVNQGPIVLEESVKVGPFCFLEGPLHAGAGTRVIEHAAIKDGVSLGHTVKIGGEVEASVIEPYTNKQHHGFLGHSYLGSWINLGAGTCNSDLKNTYGKINIQYGETKVPSGMQFLGCIMGDYSKSAINTGIFTGKVIGVCSMMYGFVTSNVPSYVNYARLFGQTSLLPAEVMINTQARMFARRKVTQREIDIQLIRDMYDRTVDERETAEPLVL